MLRKPDLILTNASDVIVMDIGVSWETPGDLSESFALKKNTYNQPEFL